MRFLTSILCHTRTDKANVRRCKIYIVSLANAVLITRPEVLQNKPKQIRSNWRWYNHKIQTWPYVANGLHKALFVLYVSISISHCSYNQAVYLHIQFERMCTYCTWSFSNTYTTIRKQVNPQNIVFEPLWPAPQAAIAPDAKHNNFFRG